MAYHYLCPGDLNGAPCRELVAKRGRVVARRPNHPRHPGARLRIRPCRHDRHRRRQLLLRPDSPLLRFPAYLFDTRTLHARDQRLSLEARVRVRPRLPDPGLPRGDSRLDRADSPHLRPTHGGLRVVHTPGSAEELAETLHRLAGQHRTIVLEGAGTKRAMGGPIDSADEVISTG